MENAFTAPQRVPEGFPVSDDTPHPTDSSERLSGGIDIDSTKEKKYYCGLPDCAKEFVPRHPDGRDRFCCAAHKNAYHVLCGHLGDRILSGTRSSDGKSQCKAILELLESYEGRWVPRFRERLIFVGCLTRRISDLRKKGHQIECRPVFRNELQRVEYQYRLVKK